MSPETGPAPPILGWACFPTALGEMALAWGEAGLVRVRLPGRAPGELAAQMQARFGPAAAALQPDWRVVVDRVQRLLEGELDPLRDVPIDWRGHPEFHVRVWQAARQIDPGQTLSYGQLAAALGDPQAAQAVGQALGRNPFAPVVPCHRILAALGRPGGFSAPGGLDTKRRLLEIERAQFGGQPGLF